MMILDNKNSTYKNILSVFLLDLGNITKANRIALDAYKLAPLHPMSSLALGKTFLTKKKEKAYKNFSNALSDIQKQFQNSVKHTILKRSITWGAPLRGKRLSLTQITKKYFDFLLSSRKSSTFRNQYHFFQNSKRPKLFARIQGKPLLAHIILE
ncbi:hypothetical protein [Marinomonas sp. 2405UD68-3]|uniref:hypothetical protein n=1 Tax=Marinomonas sp. 2405UD68-3 TaxID=3391835 RepID=UPI0039C976EF